MTGSSTLISAHESHFKLIPFSGLSGIEVIKFMIMHVLHMVGIFVTNIQTMKGFHYVSYTIF